jgi:hypothetical protein
LGTFKKILKLSGITIANTAEPLLFVSVPDERFAEPRLTQSERQICHSAEFEQLPIDAMAGPMLD